MNTVLVGLMMASLSLMSAHQPLWMQLVQLAIFGSVNSMQFTAMNTLTLKAGHRRRKSSGNSLFSLVQMLSMSLGVTVAGAILATFTGILPRVTETKACVVRCWYALRQPSSRRRPTHAPFRPHIQRDRQRHRRGRHEINRPIPELTRGHTPRSGPVRPSDKSRNTE